jgi:chorismate lyase/3-hydroxybenzoate synthase
MTTSETAAEGVPAEAMSPVGPRAAYVNPSASGELPADALLVVTFGDTPAGARSVHVPLEPIVGSGLMEIWQASGPVRHGTSGAVRHWADDHFQAGVIEVDEAGHGGIECAAERAYRAIADHLRDSNYPHLLRTWNHVDAINLGDGDSERYRGFCSGRVAGLGQARTRHPAATVIGSRDGRRVLQVYWLSGKRPGIALENPRQTSAYRYPRQYGQTSPTFSRAMLVAANTLMISGTASIVGHASRHPESVAAQVDEILANLDTLLARAHAQSPALPQTFGPHSLIKIYVRHRDDVAEVEDRLRTRLPADTPMLVLLGDVCRADLLVEFDCLHTAG